MESGIIWVPEIPTLVAVSEGLFLLGGLFVSINHGIYEHCLKDERLDETYEKYHH